MTCTNTYMFNRNQKRVAGPGFHVNVRYDDHQVSKMKQMNQVAPMLARGARLTELYDIKEQELLVTMSSEKSAAYFDGYTHCISAVNGWPGTHSVGKMKSVDDLRELILSEVEFVGVATTEYIPKPGFQEQGFVAQVGGVVTLLNESSKDIYPGQKVMLDINVDYKRKVTREKGIPREKVRFTVAPALTTDEVLVKALKEVGGSTADEAIQADYKQKKTELSALLARKDTWSDDQKKRAIELKREVKQLQAQCASEDGFDLCRAQKLVRRVNELNSRIIGKSFSYARPGDRLEVGLQPRNPY